MRLLALLHRRSPAKHHDNTHNLHNTHKLKHGCSHNTERSCQASPFAVWVEADTPPCDAPCREADLSELLNHPYGFLQFKRFAEANKCTPIALFCQEVGVFASCPKPLSRALAGKIVRKYLTPAPTHVVSGMLHEDTVKGVEAQLRRDDEEPPSTLFDTCLEELLSQATAGDIFAKFSRSPFYQRYLSFLAFEAKPVALADFEVLRCLGRGGFGKVNAATKRDTNQMYALKRMAKCRVLAEGNVRAVMNERNLLAGLHSPFLVNLNYAFQSDTELYMCMDLMSGGDLGYQLDRLRRFDESAVRFYAAELVLGLEHLHDHDTIHRDIKPSNLMFDGDGHMHIADLGLATSCRQGKTVHGLCGTAGFMAPELLAKKEASQESDRFALGLVLFQMWHGHHPFAHVKSERRALAALTDPVQPARECPDDLSDLIVSLTHKDPLKRLGHGGAEEVKAHAFFRGVQWGQLHNRELQPPFVPDGRANVSGVFDVEEELGYHEAPSPIPDEEQRHFRDFDFVNAGAHCKEVFSAGRQFQLK